MTAADWCNSCWLPSERLTLLDGLVLCSSRKCRSPEGRALAQRLNALPEPAPEQLALFADPVDNPTG